MGSTVKGQPSSTAQSAPGAGPVRPGLSPQSAVGGSGAPASGSPSRVTPEIGRAVQAEKERMAGEAPARIIASEKQQQTQADLGRKAQFDRAMAERGQGVSAPTSR